MPWTDLIALPQEEDTARLAAWLARRLGPGDTLLLEGPVGAGKSAFARALIRARLGEPEAEVPSPTFTLVQTYGEGEGAIWHADLYRLSGPEEALETGLADAFGRALCLVEWPARLGPLAPRGALTLRLDHAGGEDGPDRGRVAAFAGPQDWGARLAGLAEAVARAEAGHG
jgi:tRNA threonylcarbamoyladenosine biosynthesis protein TsaE